MAAPYQHAPVQQSFPGMHLAIEGKAGFCVPPLDGSLKTYSEYLRWHESKSPDWMVCKYRATASSDEVVSYSFRDYYKAVCRGARIFAKQTGLDLDAATYAPAAPRVHSQPSRPVVAVVANMPVLDYFVILQSLVRAGLVPFAISINNSKEALAHLIKAGQASCVLRGPPGAAPELDAALDGALKDLSDDSNPQQSVPQILEWPSHSLLFDLESRDGYSAPVTTMPPVEKDETMLILHSSGSTSFPKPIPFRHKAMMGLCRMFWYGDWNLCGMTEYIGHLPPWHALGLVIGMICAMSHGMTNIVHAPVVPVKPSSPNDLLEQIDFFAPTVFLSVPVMYKAWSKVPRAVQILRKVKFCWTGGGPLDPEAAYHLKDNGVTMKNALGATECLPARLLNNDTDPLRIELADKITNIILRPQSDAPDNDIFEVVMGSNDWYSPNVFNETLPDGQQVYATSDLVKILPKKRPEDPTYALVVGRLDDQIMHSTGEKTNPGPLVHHIEASPLVKAAIYFGREKPHVGALVEPAAGHELDPNDESALAAYRNAIWPSVQKANSFAPSHSVLFKEMIVVTSPQKPLPRTAKESVRTGVALREYTKEIEEAYVAFDSMASSDVAAPSEWDVASTRTYIKAIIADALGQLSSKNGAEIADDQDLFAVGLNSLNAVKVRNVLATGAGVRLDPNFVYAHPTVERLANAILALRSGEDGERATADGASQLDSGEGHLAVMREMLAKYTANFARPAAKAADTRGEAGESQSSGSKSQVVLVTGTTGGLGAHLLDLLAKDPAVSRVYAFNRPSKTASLLSRQRDALVDRGLNAEVASSSKVRLVEGNLALPQLGLSETGLYKELRDSVDVIIHNSWQLNFNMSLLSFEDHVRDTRHLVDLALASAHAVPPAFVFTSSIASVSTLPEGQHGRIREVSYPLENSVGGGYGEGKAVTEHVLSRAAEEAGLPVANVRIGQLSGSTTNGAWAASDWWPLIVRSGPALRCLPSVPGGQISWIPTDVAAQAILELRHALVATGGDAKGSAVSSSTRDHASANVFHVAHPKAGSWDAVMDATARVLNEAAPADADDRSKLANGNQGTNGSINSAAAASAASSPIQLVPFAEWLKRLNESDRDAQDLPTLKLRDFFAAASQRMDALTATDAAADANANANGASSNADADAETWEAMGMRRLDTTQTERASATLATYPSLDVEEHVRKWLAYWKSDRVAFL